MGRYRTTPPQPPVDTECQNVSCRRIVFVLAVKRCDYRPAAIGPSRKKIHQDPQHGPNDPVSLHGLDDPMSPSMKPKNHSKIMYVCVCVCMKKRTDNSDTCVHSAAVAVTTVRLVGTPPSAFEET